LTEALVNSATNASFIFSYTNSAKLRRYLMDKGGLHKIVKEMKNLYKLVKFKK